MYQTLTPDGRMRFTAQDPAPAKPHASAEHTAMKWMSYAGLGAGAISMAPILTQAFSPNSVAGIYAAGSISYCGSAVPTGLAASVSGAISSVPVVGPSLAAGGLATIGTFAGLALGGMFLGNYLDKQQKPGAFPWGKAIRWGCLITSALIAAPLVISGLSMGLMFLGSYLDLAALTSFALGTLGTLGTSGALTGAAMAQSSAGMMVIHALTCGLPLGLGAFFLGKHEKSEPKQQPQLHLPELRQHEGRVAMPQQRSFAVAG